MERWEAAARLPSTGARTGGKHRFFQEMTLFWKDCFAVSADGLGGIPLAQDSWRTQENPSHWSVGWMGGGLS